MRSFQEEPKIEHFKRKSCPSVRPSVQPSKGFAWCSLYLIRSIWFWLCLYRKLSITFGSYLSYPPTNKHRTIKYVGAWSPECRSNPGHKNSDQIVWKCLILKCLWTTVTNQNLIVIEVMRNLNSGNICYHSVQNFLYSPLQLKNVNLEYTKDGVFWVVTPCGSCKNDVSEEPGASFIRVTNIGELGTTRAATSNQYQGISSQRTSVASCSLCCS
jgi:hypothetical protein